MHLASSGQKHYAPENHSLTLIRDYLVNNTKSFSINSIITNYLSWKPNSSENCNDPSITRALVSISIDSLTLQSL